MEQTSLEELKRTAASGAYRRIPIWREIFSDIATPVQVLKKLLAVSDHCFLLESAEDNKQWGRYSFLGFDPAMELTCMNHQVTITTDHVEQFETENPAQVIARVIEENRAPQIKKLPPLTGGLVGYFAYDYIKYAEPTLRLDAEDQEKFRDVDLMLFDKMIAFDHYRQKIILICNSRISEADVQAEGGLGFLGWPSIARLVRGQILSLREQEFMTAAEACGIRASKRIFRHLVPNVIPQLIVTCTMSLGGTIITEATLSFLGLGVKFPFASWGNIINDVNNAYVMTNYWFIWIPAGICLLITVLGFNFVGDGLRDAFDPKMKR